jgi:hypothetical protein
VHRRSDHRGFLAVCRVTSCRLERNDYQRLLRDTFLALRGGDLGATAILGGDSSGAALTTILGGSLLAPRFDALVGDAFLPAALPARGRGRALAAALAPPCSAKPSFPM